MEKQTQISQLTCKAAGRCKVIMKYLQLTFILSISLTLCYGQGKPTNKTQEKIEYLKFEPGVSFSDFKVKVEKAKVKPNLKSNVLGRRFRSVIRREYENTESLFAGHYTLASWGCGSPCQASVIIDRRTGKIYDSPTASVGFDFQKDSRMLIVNPPDSLNYYNKDCIYCKPEVYILNENTKKFELRQQ